MFRYQIAKGNQAVLITANDDAGPFSARVYVNIRDGMENADATAVTAKRINLNGKRGAIAWAREQLGIS